MNVKLPGNLELSHRGSPIDFITNEFIPLKSRKSQKPRKKDNFIPTLLLQPLLLDGVHATQR